MAFSNQLPGPDAQVMQGYITAKHYNKDNSIIFLVVGIVFQNDYES